MPLDSDSILGTCYISATDFLARARVFGATKAIEGWDPTNEIVPLLASASRLIDDYCGRDFSSGPITENHKWDYATRRNKLNHPPLVDLTAYSLRVAAGLVSSFILTPTETDAGGNKIRWGGIYYNRQEGYLEVTSLAVAGNLTNALISLGLSEAQVEITYTSLGSIPQTIVTACGYIAAKLALRSQGSALVPGPITGVTLPSGLKVSKGTVGTAEDSIIAADSFISGLLRPFQRMPVG